LNLDDPRTLWPLIGKAIVLTGLRTLRARKQSEL
jgi:hypothetical protein